MKNFPHQEFTKALIGIYYDVYNELGYGFLEKVYQNSMIIELTSKGYQVESQKKLNVFFKKQKVGEYVPELIVNEKIIIELKCVDYMVAAHESQLLNYLKGTNCEV